MFPNLDRKTMPAYLLTIKGTLVYPGKIKTISVYPKRRRLVFQIIRRTSNCSRIRMLPVYQRTHLCPRRKMLVLNLTRKTSVFPIVREIYIKLDYKC